LLANGARPVDTAELRLICARAQRLIPPQPLVTGFDPEFYNAHYPDVATALANGTRSELEHYIHAGIREQRQPFAFNTTAYLRSHPDAVIEIAQGYFGSPFHHYMQHGRHKGYSPAG